MKSTGLISVVVGAAGLSVLGFSLASSGAKASKPKQPQPSPTDPDAVPPLEAARLLRLYLLEGKSINWGSKASPNSIIQKGQRYMGGLVADGIYGPKTQARGAALTNTAWPVRPSATATTKPKQPTAASATTIPTHSVSVTTSSSSPTSTAKPGLPAELKPPTAAPTPNAPPGANAVSLPAQVVPTERTAKQAAQALLSYVTPIIRSGRGAAELGSKDKPNNFVAAAQRDMRGSTALASDGIYGPKTQARGKELLGQTFPSRYGTSTKVSTTPSVMTQPPPTPAITAAEALLVYVSKPGADFGSRGKPSAFVKASQGAMGGIAADGIYGPATRTRGAQLTGKTFPPRK